MRRTNIKTQPIAGINIAPVINVALILVIVLIITAPFLNLPNIPVNLPKAVTIETKEKNITISYSKDGKLALNTETITFKEFIPMLRKELKKNKRNILVIIRADKDVPYGNVEKIIDLIRNKTKARRIAIATQQRKVINKR